MAIICFQKKQKHPNAKNLEADPWDTRENVKQLIKHLNSNGQNISKLPDTVNAIANAISFNSYTTKNYSPTFQQHKTQAEQYPILFTSDNAETAESYNYFIQLEELNDACH